MNNSNSETLNKQLEQKFYEDNGDKYANRKRFFVDACKDENVRSACGTLMSIRDNKYRIKLLNSTYINACINGSCATLQTILSVND